MFFNEVTFFYFKPLIALPTRLSDFKGTLIDNILCKLSNLKLFRDVDSTIVFGSLFQNGIVLGEKPC